VGDRTDFFVSHAGGDRAWAEWVAWQLTEAGPVSLKVFPAVSLVGLSGREAVAEADGVDGLAAES
jgi:hypothetical protein